MQSHKERAHLLDVLSTALVALAEAAKAWAEEERQRAAAPPPAKAGDYLSVAEVAARTGDSPRSIAEWCQRGVIAAERHGRRWRISELELERFLSRARARAHVVGRQVAEPQRGKGLRRFGV